MNRRPKGMVLALVAFMLAVLATLAATFFLRHEVDRRREIEADRRDQALWLARSAAKRGEAREADVTVAERTLHLSVKAAKGAVTAEAREPAGVARVSATTDAAGHVLTWDESYEKALR